MKILLLEFIYWLTAGLNYFGNYVNILFVKMFSKLEENKISYFTTNTFYVSQNVLVVK